VKSGLEMPDRSLPGNEMNAHVKINLQSGGLAPSREVAEIYAKNRHRLQC
jgi:hypothetical protein